jgi:hypothetical protein
LPVPAAAGSAASGDPQLRREANGRGGIPAAPRSTLLAIEMQKLFA